MNDAPPDAGLLGDVLEAISATPPRLPSTFALEELQHLLEHMPKVVTAMRRARVLRYASALRDFAPGDYPSTRGLAARVGRELQVSPETVRAWVAEADSTPSD